MIWHVIDSLLNRVHIFSLYAQKYFYYNFGRLKGMKGHNPGDQITNLIKFPLNTRSK